MKRFETTKYTVFRSKWQIVNLCSSKTTCSKPFKFSVNITNNWPFCHVKTQITVLNSLSTVKYWKAIWFWEKIIFSQLFFEEWLSKTNDNLKQYPIFLRFCGKYINFERFSIIWDKPLTSSSIFLIFVCLWKQVFSNQARKKWFSLQSDTSFKVLLTSN